MQHDLPNTGRLRLVRSNAREDDDGYRNVRRVRPAQRAAKPTVVSPGGGLATAGVTLCLLAALALSPFGLMTVCEWQGAWFGSHLVAGMSHGQVDVLRRESGGSASGRIVDDGAASTHVWYTPFVWPCYVRGRVYALTFDAHDRLTNWRTDTWGQGC